MSVQFLVYFHSFTENKLFASSLLRCSIFTGTIQCVFYELLCNIAWHVIK